MNFFAHFWRSIGWYLINCHAPVMRNHPLVYSRFRHYQLPLRLERLVSTEPAVLIVQFQQPLLAERPIVFSVSGYESPNFVKFNRGNQRLIMVFADMNGNRILFAKPVLLAVLCVMSMFFGQLITYLVNAFWYTAYLFARKVMYFNLIFIIEWQLHLLI
jgi:hypothetical protein